MQESSRADGPYEQDCGNVSKLKIAVIIAGTVVASIAMAQDYANITLAGEVVARVRTAGPYGSLYGRQAKIDQRIVEALSSELDNIFDQEADGPDLDVNQVDGRWTLSIGNVMLIQAWPEDAAPYGVSTRELVYQWRENFRRQLPKAVSPIKVPEWWKEAHPEALPEIEKKPHGMPPEDAVLVREVVALLDDAREMPADDFERLAPVIEETIIERIWTYRHPQCGPTPLKHYVRVSNALERVRATSEQQHEAEKWYIAGVIIRAVRQKLQMPAGVGDPPHQRPVPEWDELPAPQPAEPEAPATPAAPAAPSEPEQPTQPPAPPTFGAFSAPIHRAVLAAGLDESQRLLGVGSVFAPGTDRLVVYLDVRGAAENTVITVALRHGDEIVGQRRTCVEGDIRLAVIFSPGGDPAAFASGDYVCELAVNGQSGGTIPFQVGS